MRKLFRQLALAMIICMGLATFAWAGKPIKTLLITGQNNHNWPVSHVVLEKILENSGLFEVDLAVSPAKGEDMSGFVLDFAPYELVVLDYNGDSWPEETNKRPRKSPSCGMPSFRRPAFSNVLNVPCTIPCGPMYIQPPAVICP